VSVDSMPKPVTRILLAVFVLVAMCTAYRGALPVPAKPTDAPPTEFSGERAHVHSRKFAIEPRPRGGAAAARGRDYLVRALEELGVEVQIQRDPVNSATAVSFVENVIGRIPGTDNKNTIGITAHYDSVAWGPGAADDGAGVVVMLEVARALKCSPPFKNDVVFIFTGDEEGGGNGSVVSLSHPWLKDLNIMIGLEGRGAWGTPYMFETSEGNLPLLQEMAKMDIPAVSNSIMYQAHRQTPNTTDFTHMTHHGVLGYNVAFVGGLQYYHTANDKPEHLCPDTLQHQGEYVMSFLKHYGNDGPKISKGDEAVFFNTLGHHLVVYSIQYERPFAIAAVVVFLLALVVAKWTGGICLTRVAGGLGLIWGAVAITGAIGGPLLYLSYKLFYVYIMYNAAYYHISYALLGLAVTLALLSRFRKGISPEEMHAAMLFIWLGLLAILEYKQLNVASYSGTWPLMIGALGLAVACGLRRVGLPRGVTVPIQVASALPPVFFLMSGTNALYHFGGALTPVATAALFIAVLMAVSPALLLIFANGAKPLPLVAAVLSIMVFIAGWGAQRFSPDKPKMNTLTYALNLDKQEAAWLTSDKTSDHWLAQFVPNDVVEESDYSDLMPGYKKTARRAKAPLAPLAAPELTVVSDATADGKRNVSLRYVTKRSPEETRFAVLGGTRVIAASVEGAGEVLADTANWNLNIPYLPYNGELTLHLTLDATTPGPLKVQVQEDSFHLPELSTLGYRPRPDWMISRGNTLGWWENNHLDPNHSYVVKTFEF